MATIAGAIVTVAGGYVVTHGTITADAQAWSSTATWNNVAVTFTHLKANVTNTASAAASKLIDLQVGGTSMFNVTAVGLLTVNGTSTAPGFALTVSGTSTGAFEITATGTNSPRLQSYNSKTLYINELGNSVNVLAGVMVVAATQVTFSTPVTCAALTATGLQTNSTLVAVATAINFKYGTTAVTAVAVASTHKIEIRDTAGAVYYLLATT